MYKWVDFRLFSLLILVTFDHSDDIVVLQVTAVKRCLRFKL